MQNIRYSCQVLMKLEFARKFLETYLNIKFHENQSRKSRVVPFGQSDRCGEANTCFRNFPNEPKYSACFFTIARYTFRPRMSSSDERREKYNMNVAGV
jgi:hypothetical protein